MKKRFLSLLTALCLMLALAPAAFAADTSGLQELINNATSNEVTLTQNYIITETVTINKGLTIVGNGHSITINTATPALAVTTNDAVELKNVTVNATATNGIGIDLSSSSPHVTLTNTTVNANSRGIRFYNEDASVFTGASLTLDGSHILNSKVTSGDYTNETSVGDTRGIGLYNVVDSTITMKNSSSIKGFGYSINTSADVGTNGVRPGRNTYNITDSDIWGWSAFNVWSVSNTFNITNSNLRGINRLDSDWNSFATFVINNGIYNGNSSYANQVNITGGTVQAYAYGTAEHADFLESSESITQFAFSKYNNTPVYLIYPEGSTVFAVSYPGTTVNITGAGNVVQIAASNS